MSFLLHLLCCVWTQVFQGNNEMMEKNLQVTLVHINKISNKTTM